MLGWVVWIDCVWFGLLFVLGLLVDLIWIEFDYYVDVLLCYCVFYCCLGFVCYGGCVVLCLCGLGLVALGLVCWCGCVWVYLFWLLLFWVCLFGLCGICLYV